MSHRVRRRSPEAAPNEQRRRGRPALTEVHLQANVSSKPKALVSDAPHQRSVVGTQRRYPHALCSRCTKQILQPQDEEKTMRCPHCDRLYHKTCYLADTGLSPAERRDATAATSTKSSCVVCLSGVFHASWFSPEEDLVGSVLTSLPRGWFRYRNKFHPVAWQAAGQLLKDGFVVLPLADGNAPNARAVLEQLHALRDEVTKQFQALSRSYERLVSHASATGSSVVSLSTGFKNFRMRCEGRYEVLASCIGNALSPLVRDAQIVQDVLRIVLHTDAPHQMSDGCFFAQAGAGGQNLHTDGPMLAEEKRLPGREGTVADTEGQRTTAGVTTNIPLQLFPYAVNCFVPLVDITSSNGTEFYPGTQLLAPVGEASTPAPSKVAPSVPVGHVLLFDYRVRHRGLPNKCGADRPCAYVTFSQPWYKDTYNFGSQRYTKALEVEDVFLESREQRHARRDHNRMEAETCSAAAETDPAAHGE